MNKNELSSKLPGAQTAIAARQANIANRGTITANASTGAVYFWREDTAKKNVVTARIAGTFVGTIVFQIADPQEDISTATNWVTLTNGSFTAPTSKRIYIDADSNIRIYSTAWTSGTATVSLS